MSLSLPIPGALPVPGRETANAYEPLSEDEMTVRADVRHASTKLAEKSSLRLVITPSTPVIRTNDMCTNTHANITSSRCSKARRLKELFRREASRYNLKVDFTTRPTTVMHEGQQEKRRLLVVIFTRA